MSYKVDIEYRMTKDVYDVTVYNITGQNFVVYLEVEWDDYIDFIEYNPEVALDYKEKDDEFLTEHKVAKTIFRFTGDESKLTDLLDDLRKSYNVKFVSVNKVDGKWL